MHQLTSTVEDGAVVIATDPEIDANAVSEHG
jgi:hypothetical protein